MPVTLTPVDLLTRLIVTILASALVGFNRGERGRAAGLRTTMLVCLAASFSMILANDLMDTNGKTQSSFVQFDVMRLPLGVLSGVGFLGAGAILRKGSVVVGLTTAATLWFVTMMGLCFGAGKYLMGGLCLASGLLVLWGFKHLEKHFHVERRASLVLTVVESGPSEAEIKQLLQEHQFEVSAAGLSMAGSPRVIRYQYEVIWRGSSKDVEPPTFLAALLADRAVTGMEWLPQTLEEQAAKS